MTADPGILIGKGEAPVYLLPRLANRHGLVAGATGTGKTVTLQVLAEGFSRHGVPVFLADVKATSPASASPAARVRRCWSGSGPRPDRLRAGSGPGHLLDLFGEQGHPLRTTISEMGPLLLARLLELNDTQEGVLNVAFPGGGRAGLLLLDLKDLRAMLNFVARECGEPARRLRQRQPHQRRGDPAPAADLEQQGPSASSASRRWTCAT